MYRVHHLKFSYEETPILKGVSAEIERGEFVAIVGPNGAGKSTFLKILGGLLRRYTGDVELKGKPLTKLRPSELAKTAAFVAQETHMVFPFTVSQIVLMGRLPYQSNALFDAGVDLERAESAMRATETLHLASKPYNQLSGGERQRTVLASALAQDPEVLLLDEPTAFLDLKHQIDFYEIVERLNVERRMTIVSVTHDVNLAARYARRMIAIRSGEVVADGPPCAVLTPERIHEIFEIDAAVLQRPDGRGSYIIPTS